MKRIVRLATLILTLALLMGNATFAAEAKDTYSIGIIQLAENGAFTEMREGFLGRIAALGYTEDTLSVDYKNAQGDVGTLNSICQDMVGKNHDLIVTIATPATQAAANMQGDTPIIFISVSNPIAAGVMADMNAPTNVTGTSNLVPVDEIFALAGNLTPDIKTYGIIYNTGEVNAVTTVENARVYLDGQGIAYREATVMNSSEVQQATESLVGKVDAIFVPVDSMVQAAMPQLAQIALEAKVPVYGSSPVMVTSGALATVSVSDTQLGATAADMANRYFTGTPISDIPAVAIGEFAAVINRTTAESLGVDLENLEGAAMMIE